jgi:hypothetical protein
MAKLTGLQIGILIFFALTIIFTCASLMMFFIEQPYKSTEVCKDVSPSDTNGLNTTRWGENMKAQSCVWTSPKDISPTHDLLINATMISAVGMGVLSAYAFLTKKKETPEETTDPVEERNNK